MHFPGEGEWSPAALRLGSKARISRKEPMTLVSKVERSVSLSMTSSVSVSATGMSGRDASWERTRPRVPALWIRRSIGLAVEVSVAAEEGEKEELFKAAKRLVIATGSVTSTSWKTIFAEESKDDDGDGIGVAKCRSTA